jgi:hypothetical protein
VLIQQGTACQQKTAAGNHAAALLRFFFCLWRLVLFGSSFGFFLPPFKFDFASMPFYHLFSF